MLSTATNKQVKQVVKNFPHYLGDCLIVSTLDLLFSETYKGYRIEYVLNEDDEFEAKYLDIITDNNNEYITCGGSYLKIDNPPYVTRGVCDSLKALSSLEQAF